MFENWQKSSPWRIRTFISASHRQHHYPLGQAGWMPLTGQIYIAHSLSRDSFSIAATSPRIIAHNFFRRCGGQLKIWIPTNYVVSNRMASAVFLDPADRSDHSLVSEACASKSTPEPLLGVDSRQGRPQPSSLASRGILAN